MVVARLRSTGSSVSTDSTTTVLTPEVSEKHSAGCALASTQAPKRALPVKSTIAACGCLTSRLPTGSAASSTQRVTRSGGNPPRQRRAGRRSWPISRSAWISGFTITALPVARLASSAGQAFQVGKVAQAKQTATPRGTSR